MSKIGAYVLSLEEAGMIEFKESENIYDWIDKKGRGYEYTPPKQKSPTRYSIRPTFFSRCLRHRSNRRGNRSNGSSRKATLQTVATKTKHSARGQRTQSVLRRQGQDRRGLNRARRAY